MGFIKKLNKDFFIDGDKIVLSKIYLENNKYKFRKITGSRFASVLGKNKYCSPLKVWCIMVGIYKEEMDPFFMDVGKIIEPKILNYASKKMNLSFLSYNPKIINYDLFSNNKIFGGIPDGEPIDETGNFYYEKNNPMLEIKTTSIDSFCYENINGQFVLKKDENHFPILKEKKGNLKKWFHDKKIIMPIEYILQLSLYLYLRNVENGVFFVAFLKFDDYLNPDNFNPDNSWIQACRLKINRDRFSKYIDAATTWYKNHINLGISPDFTNEDRNYFLLELKNDFSN
ncbi:MAG: MPN551 family DNA-binding protein [Mycoplasmoidaceae bacterium]